MHFLRPFALLAFLGLAAAPLLHAADTVERTPPPVYQTALAPQLTPLATVLAGKDAFPDDKTGGVVLLSEHIRFRDADGTEYRLTHNICTATSQAGVKPLGSDTFTYDRERESVFLIDAATILPDGTRLPVEDKGAFIQTPQHEAQNSLYTSQAELHLVFPQIAPGAIVETVVLVRENTPVMPGEFACNRTFGAGWPIFLHRFVVDRPKSEWSRVRGDGTAVGVPEPQIEAAAGDRERRLWLKRLIPGTRWEYFGPAYPFTAPTLWLTTLRSWDDLARWYAPIVAAASTLGPELAAAVDQATAGLTDRAAIIEALHRLASEEVRYTGLEFGLAGYQPHPCAEVWQKRYGDCKDKATLLRAMLARKDIPAHLVLLSTQGDGRIEKASPSWLQFNHAILAVEDGRGGYLFCDPTAKHLPAGTLGLGDLARDVLILHDDRAEWFHTPDQLGGSLKLGADLTLSPEGELSGWFSLHASGSDASAYAEYLNALDRQGLNKSLQDIVGQFFPGAEAYDVEYTPVRGAVAELGVRVFLVRPSRAAQGTSLRFPYPNSWVQSVDNDGDRRYPYYAVRRESTVEVSIRLPDNLAATKLPEPFSAPSALAQFDGRWESTDHRLVARLAYHPEKAVFSPAEFPVFQRSARSLLAWLDQPVVLGPAGAATAPAVPAANTTVLADFPVLSNAEGQYRLLEERYPANTGKDAQRRTALGKILQWFPQDADATFQAKVLLAELDHAQEPLAFADAVAALLAQHGPKLSALHRSWGEFREACARWSVTKDPACIAKLQTIARDESLPLFRRAWAANAAGFGLLQDRAAEAAAFLAPFTAMESEARQSLVAITACAFVRASDISGLRSWAAQLVAAAGAGADPLFAVALGALTEDRAVAPAGQYNAALAALGEVARDPAAFPQTTQILGQLHNLFAADGARQQFCDALGSWLIHHPPSWWTASPMPQYRDTATLVAQIEKEHENRNTRVVVDLILQLLLHHQPDYPSFAKYAYWALWYLDTRKIETPLLDYASRLALDLPVAGAPDIVEMWMVRAYFLRRTGDTNGARALFNRMLGGNDLQPYQRVEISSELALLEIQAGRPDEAFTAWRAIEPIFATHKQGLDYLHTELLHLVDAGRHAEARSVLTRIREHRTTQGKYFPKNRYLERILDAEPDTLEAYWSRTAAARDAWNELRTRFKVTTIAGYIPVADVDHTENIRQACEAHDDSAVIELLGTVLLRARCCPDYALQFASVAVQSENNAAQPTTALRECALLLVKAVPPFVPETDQSALLLEAALLGKLNRPAEAAALCETLYHEAGAGSAAATEALCRWEQFEPNPAKQALARKAMRDLLAGNTPIADRQLLVRMYAYSLGQLEERALLERETARADFEPASKLGKELLERLAQLREGGTTDEAFDKYVRDWIAAPNHAWIEALEPHALDDPRYADQKAPLLGGSTGFTVSERFKFNLLLALDTTAARNTREEAFVLAYELEAERSNDFGTYTTQMLALASDAALSEDNRAYVTQLAASALVKGRQSQLLERCLDHPSFTQSSAQFCQSIRAAAKALKHLSGNADNRYERAFAALLAKPLDQRRLPLTNEILQSLVLAGKIETANQLAADTTNLHLDAKSKYTAGGVRLEWTRAISLAQELRPFLAQLTTLVLQLPEAQQPCPATALALIHPEDRLTLTQEEELAWAAHRLRHQVGIVSGLPALLDSLHSARTRHPEITPQIMGLLEEVATHPPSDRFIPTILQKLSDALDGDDPAQREQMERALARLAEPAFIATHPLTASSLALLRAQFAARLSTEESPAALFDPAKTRAIPEQFRIALQLAFLASRGQTARCLATLETLDPGYIAEFGLPTATGRLLNRSSQQDPALALLLETSGQSKARRLAELALAPYRYSIWEQTRGPLLAEGAGTPALEERLSQIRALCRYEPYRAMLDLDLATLRGDHAARLRAANEVLALNPSFYDMHYDRALAEEALGDRAAAKADYDVFLKYCLDSAYYQEALAARQALDAHP